MGFTIQDLNEQAERIDALRAEEAQASQVKKRITETLEQAEGKMLEMLKAENLKSFRSPVGTVSLTYRTSVKTPKSAEDRAAFFAYLKEKGLYDTMISVNSQTLNGFYKAEFKEAEERGQADFEIPGLKEVTIEENLSFRRA